MAHLTLLSSMNILLSSLLIPAALAANIQAGSQAGLYQPSAVFPAASVSAQAVTAVSQSTPSSVPGNGDPCGPARQDNPNYPNTCNVVPSLVESPAPYGINCTATYDVAKYPSVAIQWSNVEASIENICIKMEDSRTLTGKWVWSVLAPRAALGFFLPPFQGAATRPSMQRCLQIFAAMNNTCATTTIPSNYGSINLKALPGYDPSYFSGGGNVDKGYPRSSYLAPGTAVNAGYISYALGSSAVNV